MNYLEAIYIGVGVLTLLTICLFILVYLFQIVCEKWFELRNPTIHYQTIKTFEQLALAFNQDKKLHKIFKTLSYNHVFGFGLDVWKFRDEIEKEFGRTNVSE